MERKKKTAETPENALGVPVWTGSDVKQLRKDFAPAGKENMTYQALAEMMGFKDRAGIKRYEEKFENEELPATSALAFELVRRTLREKRDGKIYELFDSVIGKGAKLETQIVAGESSLKINLRRAETQEVLLTMRLEMANGLFLVIESPGHNEGDEPLQQIKLL